MERSLLEVGNGGWVRFMASGLPVAVYLRYEDRGGRLVAVELYVEALDGHVSADLLRQVPVGYIDAAVNADAEAVRRRLGLPAVDLRRAARSFATTYGPSSRHWLAQMLRAQRDGSDRAQAPMKPLAEVKPVETPELDARLDVPADRPYGDDFYRQVAEVFRRAAPWHRSPVALLAEANEVPATTAHRWVKIARQRGFLEPGRRGKAG